MSAMTPIGNTRGQIVQQCREQGTLKHGKGSKSARYVHALVEQRVAAEHVLHWHTAVLKDQLARV
jgi:hypothetical protein